VTSGCGTIKYVCLEKFLDGVANMSR